MKKVKLIISIIGAISSAACFILREHDLFTDIILISMVLICAESAIETYKNK